MKSLIISSNGSSGGKTTLTMGILKAYKKRNINIQSYKVGPDYIDPAFHSRITQKPCRNLDLYLMGQKGVYESYNRGEGDYGIIEGVMGLYDGKGIDTDYSTYHLSYVLDLPIVLVINPKGKSTTLCAEIKGLIAFGNANIKGIILNGVSKSYYELLKAAIIKHCNIKVYGYLEKNEEIKIGSRHLGLIQSQEIDDLDAKIDKIAELVESTIDLDGLLEDFGEAKLGGGLDIRYALGRKLRIGVAKDRAFSFYYKENLELLEESGEVIYFSPLADKTLPKDLDFLYIGGGYPEVYKEELNANHSMRTSINDALTKGLRCYAECGGLMYLCKAIDHVEMVGYFDGEAILGDRLVNFGYAEISVDKDNPILPKGLSISAHEFHKSSINTTEQKIYRLSKDIYDNNTKSWECGLCKHNTIGAYAHVHFLGNIEFLGWLIGGQDGLLKRP